LPLLQVYRRGTHGPHHVSSLASSSDARLALTQRLSGAYGEVVRVEVFWGPRLGKRHKPEEIIAKFRQVKVMTGQCASMSDAIRSIGVTEVTHYRWRRLSLPACRDTTVRRRGGKALPPAASAKAGVAGRRASIGAPHNQASLS
jgi:hypothetical protein